MSDLQELMLVYLNNEATDEQIRELFEWITRSPKNANEFAEVSLMHGQMRSLLAGESKAKQAGVLKTVGTTPVQEAMPAPSGSAPNKNGLVAILSLAAAVFIMACGYLFWMGDVSENRSLAESSQFATISQLSNVSWVSKSFQESDRIGHQTLELESGIVRLQFDSGVDVTLEGPAKYQLVSSSESWLEAGALVATVPEGAEGFVVDTPTAKVIDLGTSFGVEVNSSGVADVLVFDGEVEVVSAETEDSQRVVEGEAIRLGQGKVNSTKFDVSRFEKLWPISSGIAGSTEVFQFVPPFPKKLNWVHSDNHIFVATEGIPSRLRRDVEINISKPGTYVSAEELTPSTLQTGSRIQS